MIPILPKNRVSEHTGRIHRDTPRLLFLDEPTTGVDAEAKSALRASLEHLVRIEGIAVVYISHDPAGFTGLAQRVLEVRDGQVVSTSGSAQALPATRPGA